VAGHSGQFYALDIGKQTAKGTPQTTPKFKLRLTGGAPVPQPQILDLPETDNSIQRSRAVKVGQSINVAFEGFVRSDEFGFLAFGALGAEAVTGAGPYTHTATAAAAPPYFTLYPSYDTTALVDRYVDCRIGTLTLRGGANQALSYSIAGAGITATYGETQPVLAQSTVNPLVYPNVTVTLGGVTTDIVESFELTSDKTLSVIQGDTGMVPSEIQPGRWGVTGTLTILFETDAKWRAWLSGTTSGTATSQTMFTEALTITATTGASDSVSAVMTAVELRQIDLAPDPSGEALRYTYQFSAQPQATIANTFSIVTINSIATY
jgi:hypothetical protein